MVRSLHSDMTPSTTHNVARERHHNAPLKLLSIVIPALNEEACIGSTVEHLSVELRIHDVPNEIIVVDDGSTDRTWELLQETSRRIPEIRPIQNPGPHGFGCAIVYGFDHLNGAAPVVMMADASDDARGPPPCSSPK